MGFHLKNFNKPNTPKRLADVGRTLLVISAIGAAVAVAPISTPAIAAIGLYSALGSSIGKILINFFGTEEDKKKAEEIK